MTERSPKPRSLNGDLRNLPAELVSLVSEKRWVLFKWELNEQGKWTKVPYRPTGKKASSTNKDTWSGYSDVIAVVESFDGIGFCLLDSSIAAFDIDHSRDPVAGTIHPWAQQLVESTGSYCEVTVSGTGLRILGTAAGDHQHCKIKNVADAVSLEVYRKAKRYIVVTANPIPGLPRELINIDAAVDAVVAEYGVATPRASASTAAGSIKHFTIEAVATDDPRLAALGPKWIELGTKGAGPAGPEGARSEGLFGFTCQCVIANISDDLIASVLMHWKIGEHVRDQSNVERALSRTIGRAHEYVADSKLFAMNEKFAVMPIGGRTRVVTWGDDPKFPGHQGITMNSSITDFKALHDKYRHSYQRGGETVTVKLGTWWIGNTGRRQYDGGMKFMPEADEDVVNGNILNLWQGFGIAPRKPEKTSGAKGCQLFLDHGLKIICNGDEEHFDYLLKREAFIAQRRTRSEIAVALRTEQEGTGKGFWCRSLNRLYHPHAMEVLNPDHVVGKHNPHLEKLLRLTTDEALFARDPRHRNALYGLVTEPQITIEPKHVNAYPADNHLNIDVISNAEHFIPGSAYARRFFVPTVSPERANDHEYFRKMLDQLNNGGYEAMLYHLLNEVDISDFNVRDVPKTAALAEQAAYSRSGVDLLVEIACNDGVVPCMLHGHTDYSCSTTTGYHLREGFDYFVDHNRDRELARMGALNVKRSLEKNWDCIIGRAARVRTGSGQRSHCIKWPSLSELRAKFEAKYGKQDWMSDHDEWRAEPLSM
jgi:hypothetical protein